MRDTDDTRDFFAPPVEQPTIYQEDVCRPGWIQGMPEPAAEPLYTPNVPGGPGDDEYRRKAAAAIKAMRPE